MIIVMIIATMYYIYCVRTVANNNRLGIYNTNKIKSWENVVSAVLKFVIMRKGSRAPRTLIDRIASHRLVLQEDQQGLTQICCCYIPKLSHTLPYTANIM